MLTEQRTNGRNTPVGSDKTAVSPAQLASAETSVSLINEGEKDAFYFRSLEMNGIKLNEPQINAVRHNKGTALVLAGAGSGKTRVLISRTGYLISVHNVNPKNILLLTFTKKAATEMKERMRVLPGLSSNRVQAITAGTFHSIFLTILRWQGYTQTILGNEKYKHTAIKIILKEMKLHDAYEPEMILSLLSHYKSRILTLEDMPNKTSVEKEVKEVFSRFEDWKTRNKFIDFDDILLESYLLLKKRPEVLKALQKRFQYILCDEWQDTNNIQYKLIKMLAKPENNLFVVGDDDQTIYTFNGADSQIILEFDKDYPEANIIPLDINYRSTRNIVGLANEVISYNSLRHKKTLKAIKESQHDPVFLRPSNTDEEAMMIIETIKDEVERGVKSYKDFAILHRTLSNSRAIFEQLVMQEIPFVSFSKGDTFYEQSIVKPVIDYLRLVLDGKNIDAVKSILPSMYLNREKAMRFIEEEELFNPKSHVLQHLVDFPGLKPFQKKEIRSRIELIEGLRTDSPKVAIKIIRNFYDHYLEADDRKSLTLHREVIKETLSELEASANKFDKIEQYLSFIDELIKKNKEMEELRRDTTADAVSLLTIHKSKGLEFPSVFVIGASESILPHSSALDADECKDLVKKKEDGNKGKAIEALEEERRLAYVAITRAQEELYISSPAYYRGDKVEISRFMLDPFLQEPKGNERSPKPNQSSRGNKPTETKLVWDCSDESCHAWMRIEASENNQEKDCPICKGSMVKKEKEIPVI